MLITPETYFQAAEIELPLSTVARIKRNSKQVSLDIGKFLRRQILSSLDALPDTREYRLEYGELLTLPTQNRNLILYRLPAFVYLQNPTDAEVGEVVHPSIFKGVIDDLDSQDVIRAHNGSSFIAVFDQNLFKISPVIQKIDAIKYFRRVQ